MSITSEKKIVIIGGGIVGVSTAYFLTRHPSFNPSLHTITLLENSGIAAGSSGKGGGFIASWATPKCLAPLSFKLHRDLAREHRGETRWGFRGVYAAEVRLQAKPTNGQAASSSSSAVCPPPPPTGLDWLSPGSVQEYKEIGSPGDSGQVHPQLFTEALAELAVGRHARVIPGSATCINYDSSDTSVESVTYRRSGREASGTGTTATLLDATDVLVAAGPWSSELLPEVRLLAPRGHSIVVRPARVRLSPHILFPTIVSSPPLPLLSPDIYPRPGDSKNNFDTIYSSGPDSYQVPLPDTASDVTVEEAECAGIWDAVRGVTSSAGCDGGEVIVKQACYKAQIRQHEEEEETGPIVGPMGTKGLWLATGLDEWGVQNGPGVGLVMSEMIMDGKALSADVESLDPKHWI